MTAVLIACIAVVAGAVKVLGFFGYLPKARSTVDVNAELALADRMITRLRSERNAARDRAAQLALQRTNEPVLEVLAKIAEQLGQNAASQAEVLDRLAKHNGSFAHMETSLGLLADGLKALMGTIAELHDLPLKAKT